MCSSINNQEYDVFISYRHETGYYMAELLYGRLISNGYTVFMDKTMSSGWFEEKIHHSISNSHNSVVILFPGDIDSLNDEDCWLNKEAKWALENPNMNIIPLMCDEFEWPKDEDLAEPMCAVKRNNGIRIHKDYSLITDLDNLCDNFLKNVNPTKPRVTTEEFFKYNIESKADMNVSSVDVAFHSGEPWLRPGQKKDIFINSLNRKIPWRVLINTVDAAESVGQHMRDETALLASFAQVREHWQKIAVLYPDLLEVRECNIPLLHTYHSIKFDKANNSQQYGEIHIKYYAYNNKRPDNVFEHELNSFSKYYKIYTDEFDFLWERSSKI